MVLADRREGGGYIVRRELSSKPALRITLTYIAICICSTSVYLQVPKKRRNFGHYRISRQKKQMGHAPKLHESVAVGRVSITIRGRTPPTVAAASVRASATSPRASRRSTRLPAMRREKAPHQHRTASQRTDRRRAKRTYPHQMASRKRYPLLPRAPPPATCSCSRLGPSQPRSLGWWVCLQRRWVCERRRRQSMLTHPQLVGGRLPPTPNNDHRTAAQGLLRSEGRGAVVRR